MPKYYIGASQHLTQAVQVFTNTPGYLGDASGAIKAPVDASRITHIFVLVAASVVAVASSGVVVVLRLTGTGLVNGQQDLPAGILREDTTSTGGSKTLGEIDYNVDIPVKPGGTIQPQFAMDGVDPGTPELVVIFQFE